MIYCNNFQTLAGEISSTGVKDPLTTIRNFENVDIRSHSLNLLKLTYDSFTGVASYGKPIVSL